VKETKWPKWAKTEISTEFSFLVNTEWAGKTSTYKLLRDGIIESSLKECKREGSCKWAANNGKLLFNTPSLGVLEFVPEGSRAFTGDDAAAHRLQEHEQSELTKITFVGTNVNRSGKRTRLTFSKVVMDENEESMIATDLYALLGVTPEDDSKKIKSKYRRLSVKVHPDKCSTADKEKCQREFDELRQAFEVLSDDDKREYYNTGGIALVRNMENSWREVEGQQAQQMAQLDQQLQQVPHHHPQRAQFEAQVNAQKRQIEAQMDKKRVKRELESKMRNSEIEVEVPVSLELLYQGASSHTFNHKKLVICRGCRADPQSEACKGCGRCPPEKRQEPKYANTMFGRQVVGTKEREVESKERCKHESLLVQGIRIKRGAQPGDQLGHVDDLGHQTPGKLPGRVMLKLATEPHAQYTMSSDNIFTVLKISLAESVFGFKKEWRGLDGKPIVVIRKSARDGQVLRILKKGMFNPKARTPYGDMFVRVAVVVPEVKPGGSLTLSATDLTQETKADLTRGDEVEMRDGAQIWHRWTAAEESTQVDPNGKLSKDEL
jgi:DnaJ-class molecular chaperone